jgi:hypothetical protein
MQRTLPKNIRRCHIGTGASTRVERDGHQTCGAQAAGIRLKPRGSKRLAVPMSSPILVFSHPNHEIAVLGLISRMRPHIIYLTDGGGESRVDQTREALRDYQPASTHYLNHSEQSLYDALLRGDSQFYRGLADQVGAIAEELDVDSVYCDAVEFYNPVHDIALPVVRAAFARHKVPIFEVPLVYQKAGTVEEFEFQRIPNSLSGESICMELSQDELDRKIATIKSGVYKMLFAQLGDSILGCLPTQGGREYFLKARIALPSPTSEQMLRYETRGKALKHKGTVTEVITFGAHYTPIFEALAPRRP